MCVLLGLSQPLLQKHVQILNLQYWNTSKSSLCDHGIIGCWQPLAHALELHLVVALESRPGLFCKKRNIRDVSEWFHLGSCMGWFNWWESLQDIWSWKWVRKHATCIHYWPSRGLLGLVQKLHLLGLIPWCLHKFLGTTGQEAWWELGAYCWVLTYTHCICWLGAWVLAYIHLICWIGAWSLELLIGYIHSFDLLDWGLELGASCWVVSLVLTYTLIEFAELGASSWVVSFVLTYTHWFCWQGLGALWFNFHCSLCA